MTRVSLRARRLQGRYEPRNGNILDRLDDSGEVDVEDILPEPGCAVHKRVRPGGTGREKHVLNVYGELRARATQLAQVLVLVDGALELCSLALERSEVRAPLTSPLRLLTDQTLPFLPEIFALLLGFLAADEPGLIEAHVEVGEEFVEPLADVGILLDVDTADAKSPEKSVQRLATGETLYELAEAANSCDEVLLGRRVVDERIKRGRLVDVSRRVKAAMDPFVEKVEYGRDRLMVALVALSAIACL